MLKPKSLVIEAEPWIFVLYTIFKGINALKGDVTLAHLTGTRAVTRY